MNNNDPNCDFGNPMYDPAFCQPFAPIPVEQVATTAWWVYLLYGLLGCIGIAVVVLLIRSIHIVKQWERGVVYRLGRVSRRERMPGLRFTIPLIEWIVKVPVATEALELKPQEVITADDVSLGIQAVIYFRVTDPVGAEVQVDDYEAAIKELGQSALREVIGSSPLKSVLAQSAEVASSIQQRLAGLAQNWGLVVESIGLKNVQLPKRMQRAMAAEAEAKQEATAKVVAAEGEKESATLLREAADALSPEALELRRLQVIGDIGSTSGAVVVIDSSRGTVAGQAAAGQIAGQQASA
ncbi:MAG TPA: SPFH domain-containing protein [Candidatus Saccharimonadales bacterium]